MASDKVIRVCCLCGKQLPSMSNEDAMMRYAIQLNQHVYFHCGKHDPKELKDLKIPKYGFTSAIEIKRRGQIKTRMEHEEIIKMRGPDESGSQGYGGQHQERNRADKWTSWQGRNPGKCGTCRTRKRGTGG